MSSCQTALVASMQFVGVLHPFLPQVAHEVAPFSAGLICAWLPWDKLCCNKKIDVV